MIKVSKGGNDRITFISELRNKQVNQDLFSERIGLKRCNLQIIFLKQAMKLIKGIWEKMSLLHRTEYKKIKCNSCGAFNKIKWNKAVILIIFSCDKCGEYQTI